MGEYPIDTTPLCPLKIIEPNGKNQIKKKRTRIIVPLIVVLLICIIAIISIGIYLTKNNENTQIAEINSNTEKIYGLISTNIGYVNSNNSGNVSFNEDTGALLISRFWSMEIRTF